MSVEQTIAQTVDSVFPADAKKHIDKQIGTFQAGISWNLNNDRKAKQKIKNYYYQHLS